MKLAFRGAVSSNPKSFPWKGLVYPAFGLVVVWILIFAGHFFGVVYDHAIGGAIFLFILAPCTIVVVVILLVRLPRAFAILMHDPTLRTNRNMCSIAAAIVVICISVAAYLFPG